MRLFKIFLCAGAAGLLVSSCSSHQSAKPQWTEKKTSTVSVVLKPRSGSSVEGTLTFEQEKDELWIHGLISGLTPGMHGFHIHEVGDCSAADASSAGDHFHTPGEIHGAPHEMSTHSGDLGNIEADSQGQARVSVRSRKLCLNQGACSVAGRSIVVHAHPDDLESQPSGASGARVACGVIPGSIAK